MENEEINLKEAIRLTLRSLKDTERCLPGRVWSVLLSAVFHSVTPYVTIWFSARIIGELASLRRETVLWQLVAWTIGANLFCGLVSAALNRWTSCLQSIHNPRKEILFVEKFLSMDYSAMEDRHNRDLRSQVHQNENIGGWGINMALINFQNFVEGVAGILGAAVLSMGLFTTLVPKESPLVWLNSPLLAAALLALMAILSLLSNKALSAINRKWVEYNEDGKLANRVFWHTSAIATEEKRSADVRIYRQDRYITELPEKESGIFQPGGKMDRIQKSPLAMLADASTESTAIFTGFVYLFACLKAYAGAFGVGSISQYVAAISTLSKNVALLTGCLAHTKRNAAFLKQTYAFLDIPNAMYQGSLTTEKRSDRQYEVEFRNVSFKYPGAENWALRNVSMKFKVGSRLAIVGENGSGKTTFIKLLCRLYDPQEGEILLNGIDIRKYNYRDYMNIFSVVFQDFQLLSQPIGANVAGSSKYDRERVLQALRDAGFEERLQELPQGLDTYLYRDFAEDGINVSGGEAQKIAIARALYKDAPFIILDEPTAALDPIAEAEIYAKFNDIAGDKTAVYISHRLSSCKFCDEIAVFHDGQIIQQGTHEELVENESGKYYELWHAQAQYYEHT